MLGSNIHRDPAQTSKNRREDQVEGTNDGGYGWIIVIVGFFCTLIPDGILVAFGGFVNSLKTEFNVDPWTIALAPSVSNGVKSLIGLGITNLMDRSGFQKVAMGGGILLSVSMFICSFSQNFIPFVISFGVLGGIGTGMVCLPSSVLIGHFFRERIALATTIARLGSPMGGLVLAPLANYLIGLVGWCNSFIALSAISIVCPVLCLFLRPPRDNEGDALAMDGCPRLNNIDRRKSNFLDLPLTTLLINEPGSQDKLKQRRPSNVFLNLDSLSNTSVDRSPSGMGCTLQVPNRDGSIRRSVNKPRRNSFIAEEAQHPVSDINESPEDDLKRC
ncbi:monocarboxylate transporter 14-like [Tigriopus californicus]|uniref:monocarboxylate transporter 14-like n=1 Tax=Tigriopus californicus TaxID=6832 RepID=UPI0027DA0A55|nr:monocarboxylate transporter 14-like [Tigriopus californicus]